jgi:hypothetical protein
VFTLIIMVVSSHTALNKIKACSVRQLDDFIAQTLDPSVKAADIIKPVGLHFVVKDKIFMGTPLQGATCPVRLVLQDSSRERLLCQVVWTDFSQRSKVIRKAKVGVKKLSVICLDDFNAVSDEQSFEKTSTGCHFFIRDHHVLKKDADAEAHRRWLSG